MAADPGGKTWTQRKSHTSSSCSIRAIGYCQHLRRNSTPNAGNCEPSSVPRRHFPVCGKRARRSDKLLSGCWLADTPRFEHATGRVARYELHVTSNGKREASHGLRIAGLVLEFGVWGLEFPALLGGPWYSGFVCSSQAGGLRQRLTSSRAALFSRCARARL